MFIPGENRNVRSVQLTRPRLAALLTLGAGVSSLALGLGLVVLTHLPGVTPGTHLAAENERLRGELGRVEGRVESLRDELDRLLEREEELRLAADLPPVPVEVQAVGVGGPGSLDDAVGISPDRVLNNRVRDVSTSLDMLLRRSDLVASSFEDARAAIAANHAKLEATPSIWPTSGFLSSTFSLHRRHPLFNEVRPHYGIDISARRGNPIVATAGGRVTEAFVEVELKESRGGDWSKPYVFPAINRPLEGGNLYTLDPCPNEWYAYWCAQVVNGLCAGSPNTLYNRLVHFPGPGDGTGTPESAK